MRRKIARPKVELAPETVSDLERAASEWFGHSARVMGKAEEIDAELETLHCVLYRNRPSPTGSRFQQLYRHREKLKRLRSRVGSEARAMRDRAFTISRC
jgi:hypothetical protein